MHLVNFLFSFFSSFCFKYFSCYQILPPQGARGGGKLKNIYPCLDPIGIEPLSLGADAVHLVGEGDGPVREVVAGGPGNVADDADLIQVEI